jgi:hypothetical protein
MTRRGQERALVLALLLSMFLWSLPFGGIVLYPFKLLATWTHEMCHGLVMLLAGVGFHYLEVFRDTSGVAHSERSIGGAVVFVASAGYMGASLLGGFLLVVIQRWNRPRIVLLGLGLALGLSLLLWVDNDFGQGAVAIWALVLIVLARLLPAAGASFLATFLAAQACINAVLDVRILFSPLLVIHGEIVQVSDAHTMSVAVFGPPWMWAVVWLLWSFVCLYVALRLTFLGRRNETGESQPTATAGKPRTG